MGQKESRFGIFVFAAWIAQFGLAHFRLEPILKAVTSCNAL